MKQKDPPKWRLRGTPPLRLHDGQTTDYRDRTTGQAVADWIANGLIVNHVTWEEYRDQICKEPTFMECPHGQLSLLAPTGEQP